MKIAVLDGYTLNPGDNPWKGLEELGDVDVYDRTSPSELLERAKDADILVINKVLVIALCTCRAVGTLLTV